MPSSSTFGRDDDTVFGSSNHFEKGGIPCSTKLFDEFGTGSVEVEEVSGLEKVLLDPWLGWDGFCLVVVYGMDDDIV